MNGFKSSPGEFIVGSSFSFTVSKRGILFDFASILGDSLFEIESGLSLTFLFCNFDSFDDFLTDGDLCFFRKVSFLK